MSKVGVTKTEAFLILRQDQESNPGPQSVKATPLSITASWPVVVSHTEAGLAVGPENTLWHG